MTYTLNFALKLKKEGEYIVYDKESFTQGAILISVPELVTIFEKFIQQSFETTGLLEQPLPEVQDANPDQEEKVQGEVKELERQSSQKSPIKSLSGQVYYCQSQKLKDSQSFQEFTNDLVQYINSSLSKINADNFLKYDTNNLVSGIKEVFDLKNYLIVYIMTSKKQYKEGYLYVMEN
ncbi:hypothetical protein [Oscillatoria sp. HE19RPO]|uniref:hypothetical protein n=1 Tax=Oscillatoria sp. HE19RPO TaxID=2954806 RepID=UPI0020C1BD15|nr:hypothetical protein [Oscillatoria sp. HE19RPO]